MNVFELTYVLKSKNKPTIEIPLLFESKSIAEKFHTIITQSMTPAGKENVSVSGKVITVYDEEKVKSEIAEWIKTFGGIK